MNPLHTANRNAWLYFFIGMVVLLNFSGLFVPIMGPDGALYATIAKTMVLHNDYIQLFAQGRDWLDKPHFPFWITAFSFNLFGINTWAYKLPGILFMLMGTAYTYWFARILYNRQVALWAVLILLTAQHIVLSDNDVRAEPYLTGLIIASVYHFYKAYTGKRFIELLLASLFAACAIMTKGMFALVPIGGAIGGHLLITKQWKQVLNLRWLLVALLILIFILPEIWCLYRQFDVHPEKVVFGHTGVSGIRFFFWDSQFGRFFNTGPIKGHGEPTFFVHTTLWAFLPWSILLFAAIFQYIKTGIKNVQSREWFCISGALLTFLLFSASKFQLPHYLNIVFPFFAITTAQYLYGIRSVKTIGIIRVGQIIIIIFLLLIIGALHYYFRPNFNWPLGFTLLAGLCFLILVPRTISSADYQQTGFRTVIAALIINLYLNLAFYPSLLHYQAGSEAAMWINQHNNSHSPVVQNYETNSYPMEFYLNGPLTMMPASGTGKLPDRSFIFYGSANDVKDVAKTHQVEHLAKFQLYPITRLKPAFLNRATRAQQLTEMEVVVVK